MPTRGWQSHPACCSRASRLRASSHESRVGGAAARPIARAGPGARAPRCAGHSGWSGLKRQASGSGLQLQPMPHHGLRTRPRIRGRANCSPPSAPAGRRDRLYPLAAQALEAHELQTTAMCYPASRPSCRRSLLGAAAARKKIHPSRRSSMGERSCRSHRMTCQERALTAYIVLAGTLLFFERSCTTNGRHGTTTTTTITKVIMSVRRRRGDHV